MINNMKQKIIIAVLVLLFFLFLSTTFTVHQTQQALITQFGNPVRVIRDAGLHFKIPFIQMAQFYDKRIMNIDPPAQELPLIDQKRIIVNTYARYKIINPLEFFKTVRDERGLVDRVGTILNSAVREKMGASSLKELLTEKRADIMYDIFLAVSKKAPEFGIEVIDVRIGRTDLPGETLQSVFNRMRSDRVAIAAKERAEGEELKAKIEAEAEKDKEILLAEAQRKAEIIKGKGEAKRNLILGKIYGKNPSFYKFYSSMKAYENIFSDNDSMIILDTKEGLLEYFINKP